MKSSTGNWSHNIQASSRVTVEFPSETSSSDREELPYSGLALPWLLICMFPPFPFPLLLYYAEVSISEAVQTILNIPKEK